MTVSSVFLVCRISCVRSVSERHDERLVWHDKVMLRIIFCYAAVNMIHVVREITVGDEDLWW